MSYWTHVFGTIKVEPLGYSDHAREFVLKTLLDHMPEVSGSEGPMRIEVAKSQYQTLFSTSDEFGQEAKGRRSFFGQTAAFFITVYGNLRDRMFDQTKGEFDTWLEELARRTRVREIMVRVTSDCGDEQNYLDAAPYYDMFCVPSYKRDDFGRMSDIRRCPDWRYDFMPDFSGVGNWCEAIPYLVPGGAQAMHELDELGGHVEEDDEDE